ncbi:MAG: DNA methyltransferase [Bryobacteraceae bacterium]
MAHDSTAYSHQEWIGYVQPVGVVVSTPALLEAGAAINRNFVPLHRAFLSVLPQDREGNPVPELTSLSAFATDVLGWQPGDLAAPPDRFTIPLPGYDDLLQPTWVVNDGGAPILLVLETRGDFDQNPVPESRLWNAAPQLRFERLLRETGVPAGLLVSPQAIRLVYAPKGESSGHITFKIADMVQVAGRPMLAALHMLLSSERLFSLATQQRLPALLAASRKHQNLVSTKLSRQVMEALFDLLRGFQSAHDQNAILESVLRTDPNQVYAGLLTVLLRLVFVLYAEDRGLLSSDPIFVNSYSVAGLFERLREDQAHNPDTMDSRYGAWARLLALFRLIWRGAKHGGMKIPGRRGYLFDPDHYPFLEGREGAADSAVRIPRVPDGVIYRVLLRLLVLDGERLSYRNLDVEQIGSVYEAMMGFELHVAQGPSIAIKPKKRNGAPVTINLSELLGVASAKRNEWLNKAADHKVTGQAECALKEAASIEGLMAALDRRVARNVTPDPVPTGAMIFQPSPERRRSGSHYTPRSLTQPIVEAALAPVLRRLGDRPRPEQILALKVCDPAMGSGAFLVEACRQLGDALVTAWHVHNEAPPLPPDEDELLHARRVVAQRCLYGVDKNAMAADLAKLSLWLATLARDHEFTFLNHALRHGDSLAGLSARQIAAFHWEPKPMQTFLEKDLRERITRAAAYRKKILDARDDTPYAQLAQELEMADQAISLARMAGDAVLAAFFSGEKRAARENTREEHEAGLKAYLEGADDEAGVRLDGVARALRKQEKPVVPFHWEIEFPEVFDLDDLLRVRGGFDAMVGNPPFAGMVTLSAGNASAYPDWLKLLHEESHGNADLVAHFFRRAFDTLRPGGCFGLIATKTIRQGDTRHTGLRWICNHGGTIYRARKRIIWPGEAAVIICTVHVCKGQQVGHCLLDDHVVEKITAYLFHDGGNEDPIRLTENRDKSFEGAKIYGNGFTFDDSDRGGIASPIAEMHGLIHADPRNAERILPYLGGEEVNNSPVQGHRRYAINFEDFPLRRISSESWIAADEAKRKLWLRSGMVPLDYPGPVAADWPDLLRIVEEKVKPERNELGGNPDAERRKKFYWIYGRRTPGLDSATRDLHGVFVTNCGASPHLAFARVSPAQVFAHSLAIITVETPSVFSVLQSRPHEVWARFMASSMKDDLRYAHSDCFETYPFPADYEYNSSLDAVGRAYYDYRAALMVRNDEGLTKTYNRFHRPDEYSPDILKLRELHDALDLAVLDAYGWQDLQPKCDFFPEFDDEEDDDGEASRPRQKRYRYRWPDEIHDEVLARLLALNRERANLSPEPADPPAPRSRPRKKTAPPKHTELF